MFLWLGIRLPEEYDDTIRKVILKKNKKFEFRDISFGLPKHISLKISFECDNFLEVIKDISKNVLPHYKPFSVSPRAIEVNPGIIWIRFEDDQELVNLHNEVVDFLNKKYGVKPHEYDKDFIYHTTLIHDETASFEDLESFSKLLFRKLKTEEVPLGTVIFGISENNEPKTFRIIKEIKL